MECQVRPATSEDSVAISRVVIAALRESNSRDYSPDVIAQVERSFAPEAVSAQLAKRKVFVALRGENIVGTASLDGDVVRTVFIDPAHQGGGIGRHLMDVIHATAAHAGDVNDLSCFPYQIFYLNLKEIEHVAPGRIS